MTEKNASLENVLTITPSDVERLKSVTRHAAEFVVNFEIAEKRMDDWERKLYQQEDRVQQQLLAIQESTEELRAIMTEAGAARWRLAAEQALHIGEEHISTLKELSEEQVKLQRERNEHFMRLAKKTFARLDRASEHAIKQIQDAINTFNPQDIKQAVNHSQQILESTSTRALSTIQKLLQWFHWKSFAFATVITFVASISLGLYVHDELPWEEHKQAALQRSAGEALINAWPRLSQEDKENILQGQREFT